MTDPTHIVQIPSPLPRPYDTFSRGWKDWASQLNGRPVIRNPEASGMGVREPNGIHIVKGYCIKTDIKPEPGSGVSMWLPPEWLKPLGTSQQNSTCNCTPRELFNFGCQGH